MQTIVTDVRGVCQSVRPSVTRGHSLQSLLNDFGLLLVLAYIVGSFCVLSKLLCKLQRVS